MTKERRDKQIYEWVTTISGAVKFRILKKGVVWKDHLLPDEKAKFSKMADVDKLRIEISADPINAINQDA